MEIKDGRYTITFLDGSVKEFKDLQVANLREANLQGADLREANLREANLQVADLREANLQGADLREANLQGADLRGANLQGANLRGADLYGANLKWADLQGANLQGANLRGADLTETKGVVGFYLGRHFGFMSLHDRYVRIGCNGFPLDYWLEHYKEIGMGHNYSDGLIRRYGIMLRALREMGNK